MGTYTSATIRKQQKITAVEWLGCVKEENLFGTRDATSLCTETQSSSAGPVMDGKGKRTLRGDFLKHWLNHWTCIVGRQACSPLDIGARGARRRSIFGHALTIFNPKNEMLGEHNFAT